MKKSVIVLMLCQAPLHAGPRGSENYEVATDHANSGGGRATSGAYSNFGSVGDVSGVSTAAEAETNARHGFAGQLYEVLGYELQVPNEEVPEESSTQITPVMNLDDGTITVLPQLDFSYLVFAGPLAAVTSSGLVETASVYEDTAAIVQATSPYFQNPLSLHLTVLDTLPDNYGSYAADGLPDSWQNEYFGLDNPLAGPLIDQDGDGQNNRFEYIAGLVPTDPTSRFLLHIQTVPGEPAHKQLKFSPIHPGRTYIVKSNTTLTGGIWEALTNFSDDGQNPERTVIDQDATDPGKFYKVEIAKP